MLRSRFLRKPFEGRSISDGVEAFAPFRRGKKKFGIPLVSSPSASSSTIAAADSSTQKGHSAFDDKTPTNSKRFSRGSNNNKTAEAKLIMDGEDVDDHQDRIVDGEKDKHNNSSRKSNNSKTTTRGGKTKAQKEEEDASRTTTTSATSANEAHEEDTMTTSNDALVPVGGRRGGTINPSLELLLQNNDVKERVAGFTIFWKHYLYRRKLRLGAAAPKLKRGERRDLKKFMRARYISSISPDVREVYERVALRISLRHHLRRFKKLTSERPRKELISAKMRNFLKAEPQMGSALTSEMKLQMTTWLHRVMAAEVCVTALQAMTSDAVVARSEFVETNVDTESGDVWFVRQLWFPRRASLERLLSRQWPPNSSEETLLEEASSLSSSSSSSGSKKGGGKKKGKEDTTKEGEEEEGTASQSTSYSSSSAAGGALMDEVLGSITSPLYRSKGVTMRERFQEELHQAQDSGLAQWILLSPILRDISEPAFISPKTQHALRGCRVYPIEIAKGAVVVSSDYDTADEAFGIQPQEQQQQQEGGEEGEH